MSGSGPSLYSPTLFQEGQGAYCKSGKLGGEGGGVGRHLNMAESNCTDCRHAWKQLVGKSCFGTA